MKNLPLFLCFFLSLSGCAQISKTVVSAKAFYVVPTPGTIPVDINGKPMDMPRNKQYTVVMEVKGVAPQWKSAWVDGRQYSIVPLTVTSETVEVGKTRETNADVQIKAAIGNKLVHLELSPSETYTMPPQNIQPAQVLLQGSLKGKPVTYNIATVTELASPLYQ